MARPIRLDLDQERLTLGAGDTARLLLALRNTSDVVQHLHVEVRGLPDGAQVHTEPATVKLLPAATAECVLVIELPASPPAEAGEYVLGVLARSPHRREVSRCEEVRLDVPAVPGLALSVEPELVRTGTRAHFTATLHNSGNSTMRVVLSGSDPERQVDLRFSPAGLALRPGQSAHVALAVRAPRAWTGQDHRRPLTLVAGAQDVTATKTVTFVQPPRLPPVALRSLVGVVALLVVAAVAALTGVLPRPGDDRAGGEVNTEDGAGGPSTGPTPSATASPTTTPTPTGTATQTASAAASPTPTGTVSPSASPAVTGPPPSGQEVRFDDGQAGTSPRVVTDRPWESEGVRVAALPGDSEGCEGADRLVLHRNDEAFITAGTVEDPTACNDLPLRVTFTDRASPATDVVLEVVEEGDYLLTGVDADGQEVEIPDGVDSRLAKGPREVGLRSLTIAVDPQGDVAPTRVGLTRVSFTPPPQPADGR